MKLPIDGLVEKNRSEIEQLCSSLSVRELRAFGSVVTDRFDPTKSDIDVLVDFYEPEAAGIADRFMSLANGLETIFHRPVDLITKPGIKNPVFREIVNKSSASIYAA